MHQILGYEVLATLGQGARSTIYAVKDKKNNVFALKRVVRNGPEDDRFLDQAILEHDVATKVDHPSLRKIFKLIKQRQLLRVSEVYVLMELVDGMTLEQYEFADLIDFCRIMQKVAEGLGAMHHAGFVHADIKPNNIMVDEKQVVKIIDFGQSCPANTVKQRIQGTPEYIAPEQVKRKAITPATDVYNLGATMYFLLTKQHVPTIMPQEAGLAMKQERECKPVRELNPSIPPALASLVNNCIELHPDARPGSMSLVHQRLGMALGQLSRTEDAAGQPIIP
ncbi:MAG: serine/threonine-protein kinase [Phycisphaeraceae bacterium]